MLQFTPIIKTLCLFLLLHNSLVHVIDEHVEKNGSYGARRGGGGGNFEPQEFFFVIKFLV